MMFRIRFEALFFGVGEWQVARIGADAKNFRIDQLERAARRRVLSLCQAAEQKLQGGDAGQSPTAPVRTPRLSYGPDKPFLC